VFTSNVDGHFQKSGFPEEQVVECHGSLNYLQCVTPCQSHIWTDDSLQINVDLSTFQAEGRLPTCPHCGALARPNVLMFGDVDWIPNRTKEQQMRFALWLRDILSQELVVVEFGAGKAVPTVRSLSEEMTRVRKGFLIRINPREPEISVNGVGISMGAKEAIHAIQAFL
jgi:NAD-dependent SIR2 family protein deacetylase